MDTKQVSEELLKQYEFSYKVFVPGFLSGIILMEVLGIVLCSFLAKTGYFFIGLIPIAIGLAFIPLYVFFIRYIKRKTAEIKQALNISK